MDMKSAAPVHLRSGGFERGGCDPDFLKCGRRRERRMNWAV
jgi:hypothetical protein